MSFRQGLRERVRTRKSRAFSSGEPGDKRATRTFGPDDLPEAESPPHRLDLQGHTSDKHVRRVAVLPEGARIATTCNDGHVRVFNARGDGGLLVDIPAHAEYVSGLAVLDDHVLASASAAESQLHTWDAGFGERIDTIDVGGSGVTALAAVGPKTLVAGLRSGCVVFLQHTCGRQLAEVARDESAHLNGIRDISWHEDVMVTASGDKTARVWSLSTRKPLDVLRGHRDPVWSTAVNSHYVATGSLDKTLRVYANGAGFPLVYVLDGLHTRLINAVQFIGSDLIMSGSDDYTMCFTAVSPDARPIARLRTKPGVLDTAITGDGHIAWVGRSGAASVWAPPSAVADAAKEHALETHGSVSSALVQQEPPPPLQSALVDAHAGRITAGDACRSLLSAERCSASISEWWCGHKLLMLAVERGDVAADCGLEVGGVMEHDYWFKNLYLPTKRVKLGAEDQEKVGQCLAEAKKACVIEGTQAILVAIAAQLDLQEEVTALQDAGRQMLMALSLALLEQASTRAELKRLGSELTRMDRVQKISLLMNAVFSVAPLAGGAAAGAGVAVFGMAPDLIESILGCGVGLQGAGTPLVVDRFVRQTATVIGSWKTVPLEARKSLLAATEGLGMTWEEFCDMIAKANDAGLGEIDGKIKNDGVDDVLGGEVEGSEEGGIVKAGGLDGFEQVESLSTLNVGRAKENGEEGDDSQSQGRNRGQKSDGDGNANDAESGEMKEANLVHVALKAGSTVLPTDRRLNMRELESLALNADQIRRLDVEQSSCLLAAAMVMFKERYGKHYSLIERCVFRAFDAALVDGESLIATLTADQALEIVRSGLNDDEEYLAMAMNTRTVLEGRLRSYLAKLPRRAV